MLLFTFTSQLPTFSSELRPPVFIDEENNYDSLIIQPKERIAKSKKFTRLMYRAGIYKAKKIKENLYVVPITSNEDKEEKINELKNSGLFDLVEPDYKFQIDEVSHQRNYIKVTNETETNLAINETSEVKEITPNDSGFSSQYYLHEIGATKAWNTSIGDSIVVGILDSGVNALHPDLEGKVIGDTEDLNDELGHGTEVAGIIAANTNNYQGIAGIGWDTKVFSIKVTDELGQARVSTVVSALEKAYHQSVKIVQISLSTNQFSQTLRTAIKDAQERGILIISTGGNTGTHEIRYPAAFHGVIGVGAIDENKEKELYSTKGEHITLVAPGANIYTTSSGSSYYKEVSGTSFSAPQVAGTAALIWSIAPYLTNEEVRNLLIESASDLGESGKDINFGYGLLNTEKAVESAKKLTIVN